MKPGRKSAAEAAVVITGAFGTRPEPAADLTARQAEIWRETVASESADFFATAAQRAMLADYCGRREALENISAVLATFKPDWLKNEEGAKRYHALLRMRDLETRGSTSLATKMRLTNQSRYDAKTASTASKNAAKGYKPWEEV